MDVKEDLGKALTLLTPIALISSLAYLYAYWTAFDVDIFEYVAPSDIIIYATFPLLASLAAFPAAFVLLAALGVWPGPGTLVGMLAIAATFYFFDIEAISLWLLVPLIAALVVTALLLISDISIFGLQNKIGKGLVLFSLVYFPSESLVVGYLKAHFVKSGEHYTYLTFASGSSADGIRHYEKYRYLGKVGEYTFFLSPDDRLVTTERHDRLLPFKTHRVSDGVTEKDPPPTRN